MRSAMLKTFCMYVAGSHILLKPCAADTLMHREGTTQAFYRPWYCKLSLNLSAQNVHERKSIDPKFNPPNRQMRQRPTVHAR